MRIDNPLTQDYLCNYPSDAARVLEKISADHVSILFGELPEKTVAEVLSFMMPAKVGEFFQLMPLPRAEKIFAQLPSSFALRVCRLLPMEKCEQLIASLSEKTQKKIKRNLFYPSGTVGYLLNPVVTMLEENLSVGGVLRNVERFNHSLDCEVYVVDSKHCLQGAIRLGDLLKANRDCKLKDIMDRKIQPVLVHTKAKALLQHLGWLKCHSLPVIDREGTLVGVLEYARLRDEYGEGNVEPVDPLAAILSLANMYWLVMVQLISSLLRQDKINKTG